MNDLKGKVISLPIKKISFSDEQNQSDLTKVSLQVCRDGEVPSHNIYIEKEALPLAQESIKNKPLLCAYEVDDEGNKIDFKGHALEYVLVQNGSDIILKIEYEEQPVGIIPETNNYTINDINDNSWVFVEGYLFNEYCSDAVRIIEENDGNKSVSMEIEIIDGEKNEDDNLYHITSFKFLGVTLLGETHPPAIDGANIQIPIQNETFSLKFSQMIENVNKTINKGGIKVKREDIINKFSNLKSNSKFEEIIANKDLTVEELEKQLFALSVNQLESMIEEALSQVTIVCQYYDGESYETNRYWLQDVITDSNIAIVCDKQDSYNYYGIPYSINGDVITLDYANAKRYIVGDWREYVDNSTDTFVTTFSEDINKIKEAMSQKIEDIKASFDINENEDYKNLKAQITDLQTSFEEIKSEKELLEEYKTNKENEIRENAETELFEKYSELKGLEGFEKIIENKSNFSLDDIERDLKVLAFDNGVVLNKKKFSKENDSIKIPITINKETDLTDSYGGLLDKYLK